MPFHVQWLRIPAAHDGYEAMALAIYHSRTYISIYIGEDGSFDLCHANDTRAWLKPTIDQETMQSCYQGSWSGKILLVG
jgi:hypothetical protein